MQSGTVPQAVLCILQLASSNSSGQYNGVVQQYHISTELPLYVQGCFEDAEKQFYIFSCDQAAVWMVLSVCLSITPFWLCCHHCIIMKFSGVTTNYKTAVHAKGHGQRPKVKVTEVRTQFIPFWIVTPVCFFIWWWNGAQSLKLLRRGARSFSRSSIKFQGHMAKKINNFVPNWAFRTVTPFWIYQWLRNDAQSFKYHRRGVLLFSEGHM